MGTDAAVAVVGVPVRCLTASDGGSSVQPKREAVEDFFEVDGFTGGKLAFGADRLRNPRQAGLDDLGG